ncbi:MAG: DUF2891 domain-containing protein [Caulobacteraceae bacterium]
MTLTPERAAGLARIALGHVEREYPHKLDHVMDGPEDAQAPHALHPIFHGSFDWHSCVHGYWTLARVLRLQPGVPQREDIHRLFGGAFTPAKVAGERAYLDRPSARGFERPYGWAWLLKLQAELLAHGNAPWAVVLDPLARAFAERLMRHLPKADYPVRAGTHASTAFALRLAADYAEAMADAPLLHALRIKALAWYGADRDAQAWEPSGEDFLSPVLIEAACMARLLPAADFGAWFDGFLPHVGRGLPKALFEPARVSDRSDGKIAHLDGLNLSRAWCLRELARALPPGDHRVAVESASAERHLAAALPHLEGDYMGEHWLASFALLALTA